MTPPVIIIELPPLILTREQYEELMAAQDAEPEDADAEDGLDGWYLFEEAHPHRVVVWPSETDPNLARSLKRDGVCGPVAYERSMGPAVSFYEVRPS